MKRIGLIGENPNDTSAFRNLFSRQYPGQFEFVPLIRNWTGGNLDNIKESSNVMAQLRFEYRDQNPDFVVLIRDLDALESDTIQLSERLRRMYALAKAVTHNAVFLLCIFEMETLLIADLDPVNVKYGTTLVYPSAGDPVDPMLKIDPKGFLINNCGYHQNDCPELFETIDFAKLLNVKFFKDFVEHFNTRI
jgi:hypothetical protein